MPELANGAAVHRIPNQAANKEPGLFVLTGEPVVCFLLYLVPFENCAQGQSMFITIDVNVSVLSM